LNSIHANSHTRIRTIFAGTPEFAVPALRQLHAHSGIELVAAYTQPDRPAGRGRQAKVSSVKQAATALSLPVFQPINFKSSVAIDRFRSHRAELLVVAAYGLLLPKAIIEMPRLALNVHASLLPRWRGAAPIQRAIVAGDRFTGISMMRIVEALDAGPVLLQRRCQIERSDTAGSLHDKLTTLGAEALTDAIEQWLDDSVVETPQDVAKVVYAAKITATDRPLDWSNSADYLARQVRALNPTPIATMKLGTARLKVWSAEAIPDSSPGPAGTVVATSERGIDMATSDGLLRITRLQPDGKREMSAAEFINGFQRLLSSN
jgi:methionyl-tRNA formyltransferase